MPSQGGSLRLTCKKSESNYEAQDRVNSILKQEIELGYQSVEFYENISNLIENKVLDINNFFEKILIMRKEYCLLEHQPEELLF